MYKQTFKYQVARVRVIFAICYHRQKSNFTPPHCPFTIIKTLFGCVTLAANPSNAKADKYYTVIARINFDYRCVVLALCLCTLDYATLTYVAVKLHNLLYWTSNLR